MGILKDAKHRLGIHTGEWVYEVPEVCDQTRRCTGCSDVSTRLRHTMSDWQYRQPRAAHGCTRDRACERCSLAEVEQQHNLRPHYYDELRDRPEVFAAMSASHRRIHSECAQITVCEFCTAMLDADSLSHRWGKPVLHEDEGVGGMWHTTCRRCGEVKKQVRR